MITLRENEKLIKTVRQHHSVLVGTTIWPVLLAGLVSWAFLKFKLDVFGYLWEVIIGTVLIATLTILYKIYIWRKNILIITNQRVLLNIRQGALSQTVTELLYRDIYDISFKQVGLSALIYRYGKLIIKTLSGSEISFDKAPSPAKVVEIINKVRVGTSENQQLVSPSP